MEQSADAWTAYEYAVVDVEGNGQRPPDLVEVSVVAVVAGSIGEIKNWLVRPSRPITPMARRFHRITDDQVVGAPGVADIEAELREALRDKVFVAHNANVDLGVLGRELPGFRPAQVLDTLKLARRLLPGRASYALGALVEDLALDSGLPADLMPHRATYDALVCARLLCQLATAADREPLTLTELLDTTTSKSSAVGAVDEAAAALF